MTPAGPSATTPLFDPDLVDFCDVMHWFDPGVPGVDTPHWLVSDALAGATSAAPAVIVSIPRARRSGQALAA